MSAPHIPVAPAQPARAREPKDRAVARAFGAALRPARRARGLSQATFAESAEIDQTYASLLERGLREPTLSVFLRLCAALECSPGELLHATLTHLGAAHRTPAAGSSCDVPPARPRSA